MAGWRAENDVEALMYHALLRSDAGRFFRFVRESTLYVPAVTEPTRRLVTWTRGGRSFVPVFSSPEGLGRIVGTEADTVLRLTYDALARDWPDPSWWLTLNPTTPIEATLEVGDVASGVLPAAPPLPVSESFDPATADPANALEEAIAEVLAQRNVPLLLDVLAFAEVLLPTLRPAAVPLDDPYFPWAALPLTPSRPVGEDAIGVFTSEKRLAEAAGGADVPFVRAPLVAVARVWPGADHALLVNPDSALHARFPGPQVAALPEWARIAAAYHELPAD